MTGLNAEQKREKRFNSLLNTTGIKFDSPEAEKKFTIRTQRFIDVYKVTEPDRVPVMISPGGIPTLRRGLSGKTVMYDYGKLMETWNIFNEEFAEKLDSYSPPVMVIPASIYDLIDFKLYVWPGHGLPDTALSQQFVESENMRDDEYDSLIRDPSDFFMRVYLPRVFGVFEPYRFLSPLYSLIELPHSYFMAFGRPEFEETWQKFAKIGKEINRWNDAVGKYNRRGVQMGFPAIGGAFGKAPFDTIGDTLRGTRGIMKDMYSQPDKLLKALDVIADMTINSILSFANATGCLLASFPLHKGADGWMSQKQFETFYWASFKKVIDAVIKEGLIVSNFAEGGYNTRLETINQFPKGSVHWWFDKTDMNKAKQILGKECSIQGNVPVSMLITSTPSEIKDYCRRLIEVCGKGGGYILSAGAYSDEAKLENLIAIADAAREYGKY